MASIGMTLIPSDVPEVNADPVPEGVYFAQVTESEVVPAKSGNGQILKLVWEIVTGDHEGRKIFSRHNILNANATAQGIGRRELADMAVSMDICSIEDSDQLHFIPVNITVAVEVDKTGQYRPQNVIKAWEAYSPPRNATNPPQGQPNRPGAQGNGRPWGNK